MLRTCVKHNLKTILRDPATLLAMLAFVMTFFIGGIQPTYSLKPDPYYAEDALYFALNAFHILVDSPVRRVASFVGVIVALDLFRDKRTNSFDILTAGQIKFSTYYLGKLIAYYAMALMLCIGVSLFWEVLYIIFYVPPHPNFSWVTLLFSQLIGMLTRYTGCLFVPIAYAVFLSALTGIPAVGTIFNCAYYYIPKMIAGYALSFFEMYVHVVPAYLEIYLRYWALPAAEFQKVCDYWNLTFEKALLGYIIQIILSVAMFVSSYFLLKARFKKE